MENEKVYKPSLKYTIAVIGICIWASLALLCVGWTSNDMTSPIAILVVIIITGIIICLDALDIRARQTLVVTNDRIYTLKQGRFGNSERVDVLLSQINNITIKKPFHGIYGEIQVITGNDIHALVFDRLDNPEGVVEYIYQVKNIQINQVSREITNSKSNTDKIREFKKLLDEGAITKEEYEKKKKELLN